MQVIRHPNFIYKDEQSLVFAVAAVMPVMIILILGLAVEVVVILILGDELQEFEAGSLFMPVLSGIYILFGKLAVPKPHAALLWSVWRFAKHWGPQLMLSLTLVHVSDASSDDSGGASAVLAGAMSLTVYWWPIYGFGAVFLHQLRNPPQRTVQPNVSRKLIEDDDKDFFAF